MGDGLDMGGERRRALAGPQPVIDRAFGIAGGGQMMGQAFGLALDEIGEIRLKRRRRGRAIPGAGRATGCRRRRPAPARA